MSINYISPSAQIGEDTKVWHFAVILNDVIIGKSCSIGSNTEIGRGSTIGEGSRISHGVFLPAHSKIGKEVFIGPGVIFTDDRFPRVNNPEYDAQPPIVEDYAAIGAGAVILPGIRIKRYAIVGAGAVITEDVPESTIIRGEPSRYSRMLSCPEQEPTPV